uniref:NADH-ubiquinone oxidoreductase chain 2 n=1 Tax=Trigonidium sjostedti TaxID=1914573 RepID=A0A1J0M4I1_9ORTH|nr:NADH dehydrogenase subunit 2 [Trigonidium sjostedti]APD14947.1 NADH dehydrogenase subunit 2 [Trigonidium sjostedti]
MKNLNFTNTILLTMLIFGTLLTISASSWLTMWMGLEINMLAFIPLLTESNNSLSSEASLKYFLIQAMASSIFIIASLLTLVFLNFKFSYLLSNLIMISILIKLGSAPFHFWFPSIIQGLSWMNCFLMFTWQKIAPFYILYMLINSFMSYIFILFSSIWGAVGGLNQTSIRKIMTYSSINHISWLMMSMKINLNLFILYFMIYSMMMLILTWIFSYFNILHLNNLITLFDDNLMIKIIMMSNFMSLSGLPPFLGFLSKWMVLMNLMNYNMIFMMMILIMCSLLTLLYYMKIMISSLLILTSNYKMIFYFKKMFSFLNLNHFMMMFLSLLPLWSLPFFSYMILI